MATAPLSATPEPLSTAQKVRLWFMVSLLAWILLGALFISFQSTVGSSQGMTLISSSTWTAMQGWDFMIFVCVVAEGVLGGITFWRFLRPKARPQVPMHAGGYAPPGHYPYPPKPPTNAYGEPVQPPLTQQGW